MRQGNTSSGAPVLRGSPRPEGQSVAGKHTPGPWRAYSFMVKGGVGERDRICHVGTSTSLGPPRSHESIANARLIAAAPELLETCRGWLDYLADDAPGVRADEDRLLDAMRAAIAKAEGRPSPPIQNTAPSAPGMSLESEGGSQ